MLANPRVFREPRPLAGGGVPLHRWKCANVRVWEVRESEAPGTSPPGSPEGAALTFLVSCGKTEHKPCHFNHC